MKRHGKRWRECMTSCIISWAWRFRLLRRFSSRTRTAVSATCDPSAYGRFNMQSMKSLRSLQIISLLWLLLFNPDYLFKFALKFFVDKILFTMLIFDQSDVECMREKSGYTTHRDKLNIIKNFFCKYLSQMLELILFRQNYVNNLFVFHEIILTNYYNLLI